MSGLKVKTLSVHVLSNLNLFHVWSKKKLFLHLPGLAKKTFFPELVMWKGKSFPANVTSKIKSFLHLSGLKVKSISENVRSKSKVYICRVYK